MNYLKIYFRIIRKAKNELRNRSNAYYEEHHIKPKSLGGSNRKSNLVLLTAKEHFICHALLAKFFVKNTEYKISMIRAFHMMRCKNPHQKDRYYNSKLYEYNKERMYGPNREVPMPNEGKEHSLETKKKMSEGIRSYLSSLPSVSEEFSSRAKKRSSESRAKANLSNTGQRRTDEAKLKMSLKQKGKPKRKIPCHVCQRMISEQNMVRHLTTH